MTTRIEAFDLPTPPDGYEWKYIPFVDGNDISTYRPFVLRQIPVVNIAVTLRRSLVHYVARKMLPNGDYEEELVSACRAALGGV